MERADKTLSFGCIVYEIPWDNILWNQWWYYRYKWWRYDEDRSCDKIIWHPYWFERIERFTLKFKGTLPYDSWVNRLKVMHYIWNNPDLLLKPCIEFPIEWQKLVLNFLQTLPKQPISQTL